MSELALMLDEQVALAAALPHLSDLRQLDYRDLRFSPALVYGRGRAPASRRRAPERCHFSLQAILQLGR